MHPTKFLIFDKETHQTFIGGGMDCSYKSAWGSKDPLRWVDGRVDIEGFFDEEGQMILRWYTGVDADHEDGRVNEIYDGDVVHIEGLMPGQGEDFVGVVRFLEGGYVVENGKDARSLWQEGVKITILGDIHTDPELLQRKITEHSVKFTNI